MKTYEDLFDLYFVDSVTFRPEVRRVLMFTERGHRHFMHIAGNYADSEDEQFSFSWWGFKEVFDFFNLMGGENSSFILPSFGASYSDVFRLAERFVRVFYYEFESLINSLDS